MSPRFIPSSVGEGWRAELVFFSALLEAGEANEAQLGRKLKEKVFDYSGRWQGRTYPQKKVQVIYVEEQGMTVVITVYGFYGRWDK